MENIISKSMVREGYQKGLIHLGDSDGDVVAYIGNYWFFFAGETGDCTTVDEFVKNVPEDDIVNEIYAVLDDFYQDGSFSDEYEYYFWHLAENGVFSSDSDQAIGRSEFAEWIFRYYTVGDNAMSRDIVTNLLCYGYMSFPNDDDLHDFLKNTLTEIPDAILSYVCHHRVERN